MILNIYKEKGFTSRDVVNKLCKILNTKKIGHTGTLDPLAEGVLVCLTNEHTKLVDIITSNEKEYIATVKLGIMTDTLDITGNVIKEDYNYKIDNAKLEKVLESFLGKSMQEVPKYSAVSINGKRLYEYARNNIDVLLPKRDIFIKEIELLELNKDSFKFRCVVSKGTYIRSLINDICNKLNVCGTMSELVRTRQGIFKINDSYKIKDIEDNNYKNISLNEILDLKEIEIDCDLYKKVINGNIIVDNYNGYILYKKDNCDVALYYFEKNIGKLKILFKK